MRGASGFAEVLKLSTNAACCEGLCPLCEPNFLCMSVLRVASEPRVKLASFKSALNPPTPSPGVFFSTDRSKAVVLVLFLLVVALSVFFLYVLRC